MLALLFLVYLTGPLYAQEYGRITWKNGSAVVSRDSGVVHWTVSSGDGARYFRQEVNAFQANGLLMFAKGGALLLPDSTRSLPWDFTCCRVNYMYSKTAITGTLSIKGMDGYWKPSKALTVAQAITVITWLVYATSAAPAPLAVMDLR